VTTLILQNVPDELPSMLRAAAERDGRSLDEHAVAILERAVKPVQRGYMPTPIVPLRPITEEEIAAGIREGRE